MATAEPGFGAPGAPPIEPSKSCDDRPVLPSYRCTGACAPPAAPPMGPAPLRGAPLLAALPRRAHTHSNRAPLSGRSLPNLAARILCKQPPSLGVLSKYKEHLKDISVTLSPRVCCATASKAAPGRGEEPPNRASARGAGASWDVQLWVMAYIITPKTVRILRTNQAESSNCTV